MSKQSVTDTVYEKLRDIIVQGQVKVGERMPTEVEICETYNVGRSAVREAMRALRTKGYVDIRRGSGTFVISQTEKSPEGAIIWLISNKQSICDYMDVRIAIETLAVKLFIRNGTIEDFDLLHGIQRQLEEAIKEGDSEMLSALDEEFHTSLVRGTRNDLLININIMLSDLFKKYRVITFAEKSHRGAAIGGHRKVLDALYRRDTNDAIFAMREHLENSLKNAIKQSGMEGNS